MKTLTQQATEASNTVNEIVKGAISRMILKGKSPEYIQQAVWDFLNANEMGVDVFTYNHRKAA